MVIGCKVTLRGANGYRFLDTLLYIISPLSDRRKVAKFYPNNGSFNLSIENLLLFPELENKYLYFNFLKGINISINMENKYKQKPNYNTAAVRIYNTKKKTEAHGAMNCIMPIPLVPVSSSSELCDKSVHTIDPVTWAAEYLVAHTSLF